LSRVGRGIGQCLEVITAVAYVDRELPAGAERVLELAERAPERSVGIRSGHREQRASGGVRERVEGLGHRRRRDHVVAEAAAGQRHLPRRAHDDAEQQQTGGASQTLGVGEEPTHDDPPAFGEVK